MATTTKPTIVRGFTVIKRANGTFRYITKKTNPSKTQQHHAKRCDIKNILNCHRQTGIYNHVNSVNPQYLDNPMEDFQATQEKITEFNSYFSSLPAQIREKFKNQPKQLLDFLYNPENKEEAIKMGFLPKPPVVKEDAPSVADAPVTEPSGEVIPTETAPKNEEPTTTT